jgi:hypothetical protein
MTKRAALLCTFSNVCIRVYVVEMWFKVHRNVNDIRKQIIAFIKKHIIILFTHISIHNSDRKGIKYRMSYPRWSTTPGWKGYFLNDKTFDFSQSLEVTKIRKKCFSYFIFYFWNLKTLWTHNHRLVKYMYMTTSGKGAEICKDQQTLQDCKY